MIADQKPTDCSGSSVLEATGMLFKLILKCNRIMHLITGPLPTLEKSEVIVPLKWWIFSCKSARRKQSLVLIALVGDVNMEILSGMNIQAQKVILYEF